jgi:SAM-dependent methyltransferase
MTPTAHPRRNYLHGVDASERQRLEAQAELLGGDAFLPEVKRGMRVIDVGCGTGAIARRVATLVVPGKVVGVDREPEQIAAARKLATNVAGDVTFQIASAEELPYPDADFEMTRVVRPGGWVCALEWEPDALVMYPDCPNVLEAWQAIYRFQASTGVDPRVGRKLYSLFQQAGLSALRADTVSWSVTAGEPEALELYVSGAREIIGQTRTQLVEGGFIESIALDSALNEYEQVLACSVSFISHTFCRAVGIRA